MEPRSPVTLIGLTVLARFLSRIRYLFVVIMGIAAVAFAAVVFSAAPGVRALLALSVFLWAALALGAGWLLVRCPPVPAAGDPWTQRIRQRAVRAVFAITACAFLGLTGLVGLLTYRAVLLSIA